MGTLFGCPIPGPSLTACEYVLVINVASPSQKGAERDYGWYHPQQRYVYNGFFRGDAAILVERISNDGVVSLVGHSAQMKHSTKM